MAVSGNELLISGVRGDDPSPFNYDIYLGSIEGEAPRLLFGDPAAAELDAVPLASRAIPPAIAPEIQSVRVDEAPRTIEEAFDKGGRFTFLCENIFANPGIDSPLPNSLPVGKNLFIEFYMNPQRTSATASDPPILVERKEIPADGRVEAELPAGVPLFELIRRSDERIAKGPDGQIFHVDGANFGSAGKTARCVGCHAGHTLSPVPAEPAWTNLAPSAVISGLFLNFTAAAVFFPKNLVDRNSDSGKSLWIASKRDPGNPLRFRWSVPIQARSVKIHGIRPDSKLGIDLAIHGLHLSTYLGDEVREQLRVRQEISADGTAISLNPEVAFDTLELRFSAGDVSGSLGKGLGNIALPALSEVEVLAKAAPDSRPAAIAVRGDADCDGNVILTDAFLMLIALFGGRGPFCCPAAADADGSLSLEITDPIHLLSHLFLGGSPPAAPFPGCGRISEESLTCDMDACPLD